MAGDLPGPVAGAGQDFQSGLPKLVIVAAGNCGEIGGDDQPGK
jgi:hypothetical protein